MDKKQYYYFDNATTSYPKPKEVSIDMKNFLDDVSGSYGRVNTERGKYTTSKIEECRENLANILRTKKVENIIFSSGATRAINDVLNGLNLKDGEIITKGENQEVLEDIRLLDRGVQIPQMSILCNRLRERGVELSRVAITNSDAKHMLKAMINGKVFPKTLMYLLITERLFH